MKLLFPLAAAFFGALAPSCTTTAPVGDVEALERQSPVTPDPNALGNAINARNAVDYSNGGQPRRGGFLGF